jgi:hypothetical protein
MADSLDDAAVPDDEASRESFPASDPPSSWSGEEDEAPENPAAL